MNIKAEVETPLYYDPYDFDIDTNPYPVWKRMRDEAPLYYNEEHDFYALSRYDDVAACLLDHETYSSAKGTIMELIKAEFEPPPGLFIFEDPPEHDIHRDILRRLFTPRAIAELEPKVREFTTQVLDPYVGKDGFDFIKDLGSEMPMRTIGMLLGIPEADQTKFRDYSVEGLDMEDPDAPSKLAFRFQNEDGSPVEVNELFSEYLDWREKNPSDDLMTQLLTSEFTDEHGVKRCLNRDEVLGYVRLLAGAGNETTTRLIGWTGKVLAEHPEALAEIVANPDLINQAIDEILRFEPPSPVQARYVTKDVEHHGQVVPKGSVILLLTSSANRDERKFKDPDKFDIHRKASGTLTFGQGIHFCMGSHLAKLEGRVALQEIIKRFPSWRVDWDNAKQARTSTVRGWDALPVFTK
ncbi:MAG: cytochrome P450 [Pseudomonadales bacterium]|nr:cytochrome P450 [Pseudomonadales bacterium]